MHSNVEFSTCFWPDPQLEILAQKTTKLQWAKRWWWLFLMILLLMLMIIFKMPSDVTMWHHTWYLSQISQIRYVEKNLSCGEISNLYAWQMWRNLTFLHLLSNLKNFHMTDVEKSEVSPHLACIWCGECLYICTRYAVLSKKGVYCDLHRFVAKSVLSRFTHFCVEKNGTKYCVCGEKMTNIRYANVLK